MSKIKKLVVFGDTHIPFHDQSALNLLFKYLKSCQPDTIVINGDWIDCYEISKFRKVPIEKAEFSKEIEMGRKFLEKIRNLCPNSEIIYIEGNHEMRLRKFLIDRAPELYKVFLGGYFDNSNAGTLMDYLLGCHKLNITYVPLREDMDKFSHNYIEYHGVYIGHFDKALKNACYTARMLRDELGVNVIQSHTHKIGYSARTYLDEVKYGMEIGCLCGKPTFQEAADWQLGWLVAYIDPDNDNFYPYQIILRDYKFIGPDGKIYG